MVKTKRFIIGPLQTNCYLVHDSDKNCVVIDPAYQSEDLLNYIKKNKLRVYYIFITHGHFDHISYVSRIKIKTDAKIAISEKDLIVAEESPRIGARQFGYQVEKFKPDLFFLDNMEIKIGEMLFRVILTPGHSPGSVCFYLEKEKILFSGDTLFQNAVGRTDLPGSNDIKLWESLIKKIFTLPDMIRVLPGHGEETTIKNEQR